MPALNERIQEVRINHRMQEKGQGFVKEQYISEEQATLIREWVELVKGGQLQTFPFGKWRIHKILDDGRAVEGIRYEEAQRDWKVPGDNEGLRISCEQMWDKRRNFWTPLKEYRLSCGESIAHEMVRAGILRIAEQKLK